MRYLRCVTSWVLLHIAAVIGYSDLRNDKCVAPSMAVNLPPSRTVWSGRVDITMECDQGYDLALNSPPGARFMCFPNGSDWIPDYIPDCNTKAFPHKIILVTTIILGKNCPTIPDISMHNSENLKVGPDKIIDISKICGLSKNFVTCDIHSVSKECGKAPNKPENYIRIQIIDSFTKDLTWTQYKSDAEELSKHLVDQLSEVTGSSEFNTALTASCKAGSLAVLAAGKEIVCQGCSLGHYLVPEQKKCLPCKPGYYADTPLRTNCTLCPGLVGVKDDVIWANVSRMPDRGYSLTLCPYVKNVHGQATVINPMEQPEAKLQLSSSQDNNQAQTKLHNIKKAEAMKSLPPSPVEACYLSSDSTDSKDRTSIDDQRSQAIQAITLGMEAGETFTINHIVD
ncbi:uncharacterized protein LOC131945236 isoform X1 [Physella acuta]|uniref:uncharacterized protein LOC131945236 isoform X1 n=1 Tax=Physella acuta TaxID=109671 RepID=UPI0027DB1DAE|nr:uncharacterized protein LOC131945236 isoform X1 [Physella acuta]